MKAVCISRFTMTGLEKHVWRIDKHGNRIAQAQLFRIAFSMSLLGEDKIAAEAENAINIAYNLGCHLHLYCLMKGERIACATGKVVELHQDTEGVQAVLETEFPLRFKRLDEINQERKELDLPILEIILRPTCPEPPTARPAISASDIASSG